MSPMPSSRGAQGFSLIEMLAALTIFGAGVLATLELFGVCLRSTSDSLDYTQAVLLAEGLMEETLAEGISYASTDSGDFGDDFPRYSWELEVTDTEQGGLREVVAIVKWRERGLEKEFRLTTLAADRDLAELADE